jgi:hypothetical protein
VYGRDEQGEQSEKPKKPGGHGKRGTTLQSFSYRNAYEGGEVQFLQ